MGNVILDPERWESMEAGSTAALDCWLAAEGDRVHAGQVIARAMLMREPVEVLAPHDGVLEQILVAAGDRFAPGACSGVHG